MAFLTVRYLQFDRPYRHPWLTPAVAEQEMARQDFEADSIAVFDQSLRVAGTTFAVSECEAHHIIMSDHARE